MEHKYVLNNSYGSHSTCMKNQHWIIHIPSTAKLNFQHVCTLDLHRPYILVLLSFLPAWRISLCFCSDDPYLQFPLCASVSGVKSLTVSDNDGVFQFLLRSVSAPPKTNTYISQDFLSFLFSCQDYFTKSITESFFSSLLLKKMWTTYYHHHPDT